LEKNRLISVESVCGWKNSWLNFIKQKEGEIIWIHDSFIFDQRMIRNQSQKNWIQENGSLIKLIFLEHIINLWKSGLLYWKYFHGNLKALKKIFSGFRLSTDKDMTSWIFGFWVEYVEFTGIDSTPSSTEYNCPEDNVLNFHSNFLHLEILSF
jgi:hypothetical protein